MLYSIFQTVILSQVEKMLTEGATFIDLGAYSSRPNADNISEEEELVRILPIVRLLLKEFPEVLLSIDTFRSNIAKTCIEAGAALVNDISGGNLDGNMLKTIAQSICKIGGPFRLFTGSGSKQKGW